MNQTDNSEQISPEELEQVSGGQLSEPSWTEVKAIRWDSRGNATHWQSFRHGEPISEPYHYVCPHCGRLLHKGTLSRLYCDPCDEGWFRPNLPSSSCRHGFYPGG